MQSRIPSFAFSPNFNFGVDNLFIQYNFNEGTPFPPPPPGDFLLLDGTFFLLLDGTNFLLL